MALERKTVENMKLEQINAEIQFIAEKLRQEIFPNLAQWLVLFLEAEQQRGGLRYQDLKKLVPDDLYGLEVSDEILDDISFTDGQDGGKAGILQNWMGMSFAEGSFTGEVMVYILLAAYHYINGLREYNPHDKNSDVNWILAINSLVFAYNQLILDQRIAGEDADQILGSVWSLLTEVFKNVMFRDPKFKERFDRFVRNEKGLLKELSKYKGIPEAKIWDTVYAIDVQQFVPQSDIGEARIFAHLILGANLEPEVPIKGALAESAGRYYVEQNLHTDIRQMIVGTEMKNNDTRDVEFVSASVVEPVDLRQLVEFERDKIDLMVNYTVKVDGKTVRRSIVFQFKSYGGENSLTQPIANKVYSLENPEALMEMDSGSRFDSQQMFDEAYEFMDSVRERNEVSRSISAAYFVRMPQGYLVKSLKDV